MATMRCTLLFGLVAGTAAVDVTPVAKVIDLIKGLKKEVEDEGSKEASSYDKFACFCKDTSNKKSNSVKKGNDNINTLSADIADKTQSKEEDITELGDRKRNQEKMSKELDETMARCAKEKAAYEAEAADLNKAISSLKSAIKAMQDSNIGGAALIEMKRSVVENLSPLLALSKKTGSQEKARKVLALLQQQVDPNDPNYKFHSNDIIDICKKLLTDFKNEKSDLDTEWGKTDKACKETKASLRKEMKTNKENMEKLNKEIQKLSTEIADHREDLVQAEADLKDDELYLKDLTARCEVRANDYDQRSQMRGDELQALTSALEVLTKEVKGRDEDANERAAALLQKPKRVALVQAKTATPVQKAVSFLQAASVKAHSQGFLSRAESSSDLELETRKNSALALLRTEGRRLSSVTLASLTVRAAADPFKKVKGLIQKLIERLLEESRAEATKKGFCDTSIANAEHDRDARYQDVNDLNRELRALESKEDELTTEMDRLSKDIKDESKDLKETTKDRQDEKEDNLETVKIAKEGLEAVTEALLILKSFYSNAAKAASFVQASPLDEDTAGAGFSGSYKGKQGGMKAVFALLETIQSDFDRTVRKTEEAEDKAHRGFVEFSQGAKSSIAGKETKHELDDQDLEETRTSIKQKSADLESNMDLLDKSLQELEELKPTCIDTGMSYKERVEKREEEIKALENALKILAPP